MVGYSHDIPMLINGIFCPSTPTRQQSYLSKEEDFEGS
jgi:hypothetical protein